MKFLLKEHSFKKSNNVWFAWYPVFCEDGYIRWLERVQYKLEVSDGWMLGMSDSYYTYQKLEK